MPTHKTPGSRRAFERKAFALLFTSVVVLAACSGGDNQSITVEGNGEGAPGIEGEGSGPIEFSDDDGGGSVVLGGGEVPDDFPDDIPLPDDYEVTAAFTGSTSDSNATANVSGVTGESLDALHALYSESLPEAEYTIVSDVSDPIDGAAAFAFTFDGNGITGGKVTFAERDFSGENPDKFSLSVAY